MGLTWLLKKIKFEKTTTYITMCAYRTVNFKNGKISGIWEWADYGGLINLLNWKKK
jgi:hypothetical protein